MIAKQGQSFFDLVIQGTGSIDEAFAMALANNGRSVTDDVVIGEHFEAHTVARKSIVSLFSYQVPATAGAEAAVAPPAQGGIGYMGIEIDFVVS
ncbi:hypothetical protein [Formosa sp. S-31]|uniref:hypothetical protein n=1 Tax=Formosa sp. S-31 TaxID=2790949 RepID=UPI003EBD4DE8